MVQSFSDFEKYSVRCTDAPQTASTLGAVLTLLATALAVFFTGLLAGEEFIVRYGIHPALASQDGAGQVSSRQALIMRLRVVVPVLFGLSLVSTVLALVAAGGATGLAFRVVGVAALAVWALSTFLGTVRINQVVIEWDATAPPADWQRTIARWGRIDVLRSSAAIVAFGALLAGALLT